MGSGDHSPPGLSGRDFSETLRIHGLERETEQNTLSAPGGDWMGPGPESVAWDVPRVLLPLALETCLLRPWLDTSVRVPFAGRPLCRPHLAGCRPVSAQLQGLCRLLAEPLSCLFGEGRWVSEKNRVRKYKVPCSLFLTKVPLRYYGAFFFFLKVID